jgi:hypothetical protein
MIQLRRWVNFKTPHSKALRSAIVTGMLSVPILLYVAAQFSRPPRTNEMRSLFPGVTYKRQASWDPRPNMVHVVTIDLNNPSTKPFVSPGLKNPDPKGNEMSARTVSEFVKEFDVQVAINANFFSPFREEAPWDFYPRSGELTNTLGQSTSDGTTVSPAEFDWSAICFLAQNRVEIVERGICPPNTLQAVAGNDLLVKNGRPVPPPPYLKDDKPYSRTVVAIDQTGKKLWLVLVDGKQFQYSEGMTLAEMTQFLMKLRVDTALNLDGGGSVTLAVQTPKGVKVLNAPIQNRIPMRERPVANQLGFFVK